MGLMPSETVIGSAQEFELSEFAPRMLVLQISPDKIKDVIGPGGKVINKIIADTGVKIDIENDGRVFISSPDGTSAEKAKAMVEALTKEQCEMLAHRWRIDPTASRSLLQAVTKNRHVKSEEAAAEYGEPPS